MKCSEIQLDLALHASGVPFGAGESNTVRGHLDSCPVCRQRYLEHLEMNASLRRMRRAEISSALKTSIKKNLRAEIHTSRNAWLPISRDLREWLMLRLMPYSVGVCASLLVALTFLTMMSSGMLGPRNEPSSIGRGETLLLAGNRNSFDDGGADISPSEYAKSRLGFADESPSINPRGALVALTKSLVRRGIKSDEVVVVADVFSSGLAQIADVVEPSSNCHAVSELQKALDSDPAYAPFVPASLENRPDSVRVILRFQSVNVDTAKPRRRR